ncbi:Oidioi.mRNA.OKI2018_I69.PAR.g12240.t1.cds [Oikopleura dioica]|uniref:Oidioi.mRNA.OKI2018_I69.PAR.g12240.t1.cds n=1 Tax=Oikopleura dioica TaxID=34765 RepID=A0ABN7S2L8_OIKDI|nr:Oidioi.mRNA.OKI2018_I69.PAR.g12240.t1.cds [Oikopleura dioica]
MKLFNFFLAVAMAQSTLSPRGKIKDEEKGPRQCGKVKLADNPLANGLTIECKSRNGKAKNPHRTKRCKARCVDSKRNNNTPKKFFCVDNKWMNKKGTQELNVNNLGCK